VTSTHGAWEHAGVRFLLSGALPSLQFLFVNSMISICFISSFCYLQQIRDSIVVSISACHAEDPGSIPGRGVLFSILLQDAFDRTAFEKMVPPGLEPGTFRLLAERSNQLSYRTRCEMTPSSFTTQNIKSSQQPLKPTPLKEETFAPLARIACASHSNENTSATSARSVAASYKPPMLVTRVRLPACAFLQPCTHTNG
jgi:hypothetical protein